MQVVDQTSAVLGHGLEERRAVQADHRGMVKLKGRQDPGYKDFIAVIERVQQLPLPSSRRKSLPIAQEVEGNAC